jgi:predicted nucleic acid-binding protein
VLCYLDSSVLLRVIFKESAVLKEFRDISHAVSSDLLRVECLRTIDRILFFEFQKNIELIPVTREILTRASQPFPTSLGSLDAIHLASCILYRERIAGDVLMCTHDQALHRAASALGLQTLGG